MYSPLLLLHSWLRWFVLLTGLFAVARAIAGMNGRRSWSAADSQAGLLFMIGCDLQLLIGLALYLVFSPVVQAAVGNLGAAMRNPEYRFFVVEHAIGMVIAIVLAHLGRARSKKGPDTARFKRAAIFYGLALLIMLASIPWPGMAAGRPLIRGF